VYLSAWIGQNRSVFLSSPQAATTQIQPIRLSFAPMQAVKGVNKVPNGYSTGVCRRKKPKHAVQQSSTHPCCEMDKPCIASNRLRLHPHIGSHFL